MGDSDFPDPNKLVARAIEAGRNIRFGRGVGGRTAHAMIALIGVWAMVVWKLGPDPLTDAAAIGAGLVISAIVVWWTGSSQKFAERNPGLAVLDGAEFLEYKRFEAATKGGTPPGAASLVDDSVITALPREA